jgi:hypothetical protein
MEEGIMKYLPFIVLLVAVLITAGCVGGNNSAVVAPNQTTTQHPSFVVTTIVQPQTVDVAATSKEPTIIDEKFDRGYAQSDQDAIVYVLRWQMDDSANKNDFRTATYYKTELLKAVHNYIEIDSALTHFSSYDKNAVSEYSKYDIGHTQVALALEKCLNEYDVKDKTDLCKTEWNNFNQSIKNF